MKLCEMNRYHDKKEMSTKGQADTKAKWSEKGSKTRKGKQAKKTRCNLTISSVVKIDAFR